MRIVFPLCLTLLLAGMTPASATAPDEAAMLEQASVRGRAIYAYDRAA